MVAGLDSSPVISPEAHHVKQLLMYPVTSEHIKCCWPLAVDQISTRRSLMSYSPAASSSVLITPLVGMSLLDSLCVCVVGEGGTYTPFINCEQK